MSPVRGHRRRTQLTGCGSLAYRTRLSSAPHTASTTWALSTMTSDPTSDHNPQGPAEAAQQFKGPRDGDAARTNMYARRPAFERHVACFPSATQNAEHAVCARQAVGCSHVCKERTMQCHDVQLRSSRDCVCIFISKIGFLTGDWQMPSFSQRSRSAFGRGGPLEERARVESTQVSTLNRVYLGTRARGTADV